MDQCRSYDPETIMWEEVKSKQELRSRNNYVGRGKLASPVTLDLFTPKTIGGSGFPRVMSDMYVEFEYYPPL